MAWDEESSVLPLRNSRESSDGLESAGVTFDAESSHRQTFSDDGQDEHNTFLRENESDSQSAWPTLRQIYPMLALAGIYVVHQSVVSCRPSITMALALINDRTGH